MEREIESTLEAIEKTIAENLSKCRKNVFETIGILHKKHPNDSDEINTRFKEICKKYGVNFYSEIGANYDDINRHVEENVKTI